MGLFLDTELLGSIGTSVVVACWVTVLSVVVGTANAFLMERDRFPGKQLLSVLMLVPLVIPGVILGISILALCEPASPMSPTTCWDSTWISCGPGWRWWCSASSHTSRPSRR